MHISDDIVKDSDNIVTSSAIYNLFYSNNVNLIVLETIATFKFSTADKCIYLGGSPSLRMIDYKNNTIIGSSSHFLAQNVHKIDLSNLQSNRLFIFIKNSTKEDAVLVVNTNDNIDFLDYKDYALYAILWFNTAQYTPTDLFSPSMKGYIYNDVYFSAKITEIVNNAGNSTTSIMSQKAVTEEINKNTSYNLLKNKNIYSLGDSLSYGGIWQEKLCKITGCIFDSDFNKEQSISVGGTTSGPCGNSCGQERVKNLSKSENPIDVLFIENVNDKSFITDNNVGTINDSPWFVRKTIDMGVFNNVGEIESYFDDNFTSIIGDANIGTVLQAKYKSSGKAYTLKINSAPSKGGTFTINCYGTQYNINIEQTDEITDVIRKVLEYSYVGWDDDLLDDNVILFTRTIESDSKRWVQVNAGDTGIDFTFEEADGEGLLKKYYFLQVIIQKIILINHIGKIHLK